MTPPLARSNYLDEAIKDHLIAPAVSKHDPQKLLRAAQAEMAALRKESSECSAKLTTVGAERDDALRSHARSAWWEGVAKGAIGLVALMLVWQIRTLIVRVVSGIAKLAGFGL